MANNFIEYFGHNIGKSVKEKNCNKIVKEIILLSKEKNCQLIYPDRCSCLKKYEWTISK